MKKQNVLTGSMVAAAAATLFACASNGSAPKSAPASMASAEMVKCAGVNACKGTGACAGQGHDCAGHNACKGQGWIETSADSCEADGGKVI